MPDFNWTEMMCPLCPKSRFYRCIGRFSLFFDSFGTQHLWGGRSIPPPTLAPHYSRSPCGRPTALRAGMDMARLAARVSKGHALVLVVIIKLSQGVQQFLGILGVRFIPVLYSLFMHPFTL